MISDLQYMCFELRSECNYMPLHPWCPSTIRELKKGPLLHDDIIEQFIRTAQRRGFQGKVGFHYYSEPLLDKERILAFMHRVTGVDYVLWTNGSLLTMADRNWLPLFKQVSISIYNDRDEAKISVIIKGLSNCVAERPQHDRRIDVYRTNTLNPGACMRPSRIELPVDCWGDVHVCCADYDGRMQVGNILRDDHDYCINKFLQWAREIQLVSVPFCWRCRSIHSPAVPQ